jgi:antitoxin HicB
MLSIFLILVKNHGMLQFTQEVMRMKVLNYRVLLRKEPEGGFTVVVPSLPGCITYGETIEEAIAMSREAIELYLDSLIAEGEEILSDEETMEYTLNLQRDDL